MADQDDGLGGRSDASSTPWEELADPAHDDGQAVLDALARRARRLGRRTRRTRDAPVRILKLMD
jgi:glycine/D-amino acid oxidase-like deaminating enzyme